MRPRNPPADTQGFWTPSRDFLAQVNHLLAAALIVLAAGQAGWDLDWTLGLLLLATALKEFVADRTFLEHDSLAGSCTDWAFYFLGALDGRLTLWDLLLGAALMGLLIAGLTLYDIAKQHALTPYD